MKGLCILTHAFVIGLLTIVPSTGCESDGSQQMHLDSADTPIAIRGGSVHVLSGTTFSKLAGSETFSTSVGTDPANRVTVSGVDKNFNAAVPPRPILPTEFAERTATNWLIQIWFRDGNGIERILDREKYELDICSRVDIRNVCIAGDTGQPTDKVYFVTGSQSYLTEEKLERTNLRYLTKSGHSDKAERMYRITVSGVPNLNGDYRCIDGLCDIKIEHQ